MRKVKTKANKNKKKENMPPTDTMMKDMTDK